MTEEKLRECFKEQLPALPLGFEERNNALLNRLTKQEAVMKRKISFSLVFAMVLLVAVLGIAVAAELGAFGQLRESWFGKKMEHLEQVAEVQNQQVDVPQDEFGFPAAQFTLTQSYYDGKTLYAGYRLTLGATKALVQDTVDASSIAWDITPADEGPLTDWESMLSPEDYALMQKTLNEKGEVFLTVYEQFLGDGLYLADGEYADPVESDESLTEAGDRVGYTRVSLPNAANQDAIEVSFPLVRIIRYYYQNANGSYHKFERMEDRLLQATIAKNTKEAEPTVHATTFWGHEAQVKLWVSDIDIRARIGIKLPEEMKKQWDNQWDDLTIDALELFKLYADGKDVRVRATQIDSDETYSLIMDMDFDLPDSFHSLKLIPRYSLSGEHEDEALVLK